MLLATLIYSIFSWAFALVPVYKFVQNEDGKHEVP